MVDQTKLELVEELENAMLAGNLTALSTLASQHVSELADSDYNPLARPYLQLT